MTSLAQRLVQAAHNGGYALGAFNMHNDETTQALLIAAERSNSPARTARLGTLVASGLIVGESLFGVLNAGLIVALASDAPIALVPESFAPAKMLGMLGFVALVVGLYRWMLRRNLQDPSRIAPLGSAAP